MNPRPLAALAALLLATTAAHAAGNESLAYSIGNCASFTDDNARLACYDQLAAQLKAGAVAGVPAAQAAPPPQAMPSDATQASLPPAQQAAPPPAQYTPPPSQYAAAPPQYAPPPSQYAQQNYAPPPPVKEKKAWYDPTGWFGDDSEDTDTENQTTPAQFGSDSLPPPAQQQPAPMQYQYPPAGTQPAAPPVQTAQYPAAPPPAQAPAPAPYPTSVEPSVQTTPAQFGSESLPPPPQTTMATPAALDSISAKVVDYAFNPYGRFTVFLDNGQVWQQLESDAPVRFSKGKRERKVTISRGALGSYNLVFDDHKQVHKVKRIK